MTRRSDLLDIAVILHHETEKAWLVSDDGDRARAVWIPKSQAEIEAVRGCHILTLPARLAVDRGLA